MKTLRKNVSAVRAALLFEGRSHGCAGLERQFLRQHVKVVRLGDAIVSRKCIIKNLFKRKMNSE